MVTKISPKRAYSIQAVLSALLGSTGFYIAATIALHGYVLAAGVNGVWEEWHKLPVAVSRPGDALGIMTIIAAAMAVWVAWGALILTQYVRRERQRLREQGRE